MSIKRILSVLLCTILLFGTLPASAEEPVINEPDMAAYAACVNGLAVEFGIPVILWDCSVHVNRAKLSVNYPQYIDAIMGCYPERTVPGNGKDKNVFEDETAFEAAAAFGPGFNLGNTQDSTSFNIANVATGQKGWIVLWGAKDAAGNLLPRAWETAWGQPETTEAIADYIVGLGFNTIRIPVTWAEHLDENDQIDPLWMARVKEVVDLFYTKGVYCILNLHHDGGANGWIEATESSYSTYGERFASVWAQIAETFADYDAFPGRLPLDQRLEPALRHHGARHRWEQRAPQPDRDDLLRRRRGRQLQQLRDAGGSRGSPSADHRPQLRSPGLHLDQRHLDEDDRPLG